MIDVHSHILYSVDDGPSKIEDSLRMVSEANKLGIKVIFSTVHFHESLFPIEKLKEKYQKLSVRCADFGITLKLGYEIFINSITLDNIDQMSALTMNNTRYILIEFPYSEFPTNSLETIYALQQKSMVPIIAHPERCRFFIENTDVLISFLESGCLSQIDAASVIGVYGRHAKNLAKKLAKLEKINFVASNAHFADDYSDWYQKAFIRMKSWTSSHYAENVFRNNAGILLDGAADSGQKNKIISIV